MEAADSLYGVSMGSDGISKVISRRLAGGDGDGDGEDDGDGEGDGDGDGDGDGEAAAKTRVEAA
jgi:hypothetical protein